MIANRVGKEAVLLLVTLKYHCVGPSRPPLAKIVPADTDMTMYATHSNYRRAVLVMVFLRHIISQ